MPSLKSKIKSNKTLKKVALWLLMSENDPRPRLWIRLFVNPWVSKKSKGAIVRWHARMDIFPFNQFSLGVHSIIEDFTVVNNAVGNVHIGNETMIGIGSTVIGPVSIGNNVMLAQHVVLSGLNHGYEDVSLPPSKQPVSVKKITVEDNVWIGANAVITAGITVGKHAVVGAGSIVTKDVPPYSIVVGNPAKIIKKYDHENAVWESIVK